MFSLLLAQFSQIISVEQLLSIYAQLRADEDFYFHASWQLSEVRKKLEFQTFYKTDTGCFF